MLAAFAVAPASPARAADCNTNGTNDAAEFDCNGNGTPDACDLAAGGFDANTNNTIDLCEVTLTGVIIVDSRAPLGGNGRSWARPYRDLATGIAVAAAGENIWIAKGSYKPTTGTNRTTSFTIKQGVGLYGGFKGGELQLAQRDWRANESILTGDLLGNDGPNFANNTENSLHVLRGQNTGNWTLDGLTIRGGNANGAFDADGGAIIVNAGGLTGTSIRNCTIIGNSGNATGAAALSNVNSMVIEHTRFLGNRANAPGGTGSGGGGALRITGFGPSQRLVNCEFSGNTAINVGGGALIAITTLDIINCTFSRNSTNASAGAIYNNGATLNIRNSILWGNTSPDSNGERAQIFGFVGVYNISNTCIQNLSVYAGNGNTAAHPHFVNDLGDDGIPGTADDDYRLSGGTPLVDGGDNAQIPAGLLVDLGGQVRVAEGGGGGPARIDMGAYEFAAAGAGDCNTNGYTDSSDIADGRSFDAVPIGGDGHPDECQTDCNTNGTADGDDLLAGAPDCDANAIPDVCFLADCNTNGTPDACDIGVTSNDCIANGVPDECEGDCNANCVTDADESAPAIVSDVSTNIEPFFVVGVSHTIVAPPLAVGPVTLEFTALRDFANLQYVRVDLNGTVAGIIDWQPAGGGVCRTQNGTLTLSGGAFNALVAGGNAVLTMTPIANGFASCTPSYIRVTTNIHTSSPTADCNGNGLLDSCELGAISIPEFVGQLLSSAPPSGIGCLMDITDDGRVDGADIEPYLQQLLAQP